MTDRTKAKGPDLVPVGESSSRARPSRKDAEAAVRTLLLWSGDDPDREGLRNTPARVVKAYEEFFSGYKDDPVEMLKRTFEETDGYDEMVVLRDIHFTSHCEHHILPIIGKAHVGYLPDERVIGISKLPVWFRHFPTGCRFRKR